MALPVADPQFWIVTGAAAVALAIVLRRLFRRPSKGALPCAKCPQAGRTGHPRASGGAGSKSMLWALLACAAAAHAAGERGAPPAAVVERDVAAMGTQLKVVISALDRPSGLALSAAIVGAVEDAEHRLSTWRATSEFQTFNAAPAATRVALSPLAWHAVTTAVDCWKESAGAFDPTVAPLVEAWGLRTGGRLPSGAEIESARRAVGAGRLALDPERRELLQPGGLRLEEGGFGKGAALDAALDAARSLAPAAQVVLDFGGQLAWTGRTEAFAVGLADPRDRSRTVLELTLDAPEGSLSTSGNSERGSLVGDVRIGHLLDPRTGRPARDIGSATVFAPQATVADCRSTGLYVLGAAEGAALMARWSRAHQGEAVLILVEPEGLRALVTAGLAPRVLSLTPELRIETVAGFS